MLERNSGWALYHTAFAGSLWPFSPFTVLGLVSSQGRLRPLVSLSNRSIRIIPRKTKVRIMVAGRGLLLEDGEGMAGISCLGVEGGG